jgi:hypothetical protein
MQILGGLAFGATTVVNVAVLAPIAISLHAESACAADSQPGFT